MQYRNLGTSGLKVSALSFGSWVTFGDQVDDGVAGACMKAAYDGGVNFFDNAEGYAEGLSETMMGGIIRKIGWKRSDLIVSTKIFWGGEGPNDRGLSRKHIIEGTDASLQRLGMDYVDLLFCHRPDQYTPIEETVRAMNHVIDQGKAFYWGTSEWNAEQIREACEIARREHLIAPTMEQPQYNMFHRDRVEREYANLYRDCGLGTTIWSPLASGLLTGKYNDGVPAGSRLALEAYGWLKDQCLNEEAAGKIEKVQQLSAIAGRLECSMPQLALAWCLKNPHVSTVITGASRPEQVTENLKALEIVERINPEIDAEIERILQNRPEPDRDWRAR
ncbi:MAG: potassium channel beta subunit family protein [Planctomycetota bacterium]|jgi:voltage-dependent potassium channel beta subunit